MKMNRINYNNVNKVCFGKFDEMIDAKRVIYNVVALLEQYKGAFIDKVVPLFTLINSYIVFRNLSFLFMCFSQFSQWPVLLPARNKQGTASTVLREITKKKLMAVLSKQYFDTICIGKKRAATSLTKSLN